MELTVDMVIESFTAGDDDLIAHGARMQHHRDHLSPVQIGHQFSVWTPFLYDCLLLERLPGKNDHGTGRWVSSGWKMANLKVPHCSFVAQ